MTHTTVKQLSTVAPANVCAALKTYAAEYRLRNIRFEMKAAGQGLYLGEDCSYRFYLPNGDERAVSMGGEWGGYKTGVAGAIGGQVPMPAGSWAVEFQIFCGKPMLHVYHWGLAALEGGK